MCAILFDPFPHKVSASADEAPEIIRELQAFRQFLQREFHLENAAVCLTVLDDEEGNERPGQFRDRQIVHSEQSIHQPDVMVEHLSLERLQFVGGNTVDEFDRDKVDEIVLVLMQLTLHDPYRAWKGFD